jgi:hypothetical protein
MLTACLAPVAVQPSATALSIPLNLAQGIPCRQETRQPFGREGRSANGVAGLQGVTPPKRIAVQKTGQTFAKQAPGGPVGSLSSFQEETDTRDGLAA